MPNVEAMFQKVMRIDLTRLSLWHFASCLVETGLTVLLLWTLPLRFKRQGILMKSWEFLTEFGDDRVFEVMPLENLEEETHEDDDCWADRRMGQKEMLSFSLRDFAWEEYVGLISDRSFCVVFELFVLWRLGPQRVRRLRVEQSLSVVVRLDDDDRGVGRLSLNLTNRALTRSEWVRNNIPDRKGCEGILWSPGERLGIAWMDPLIWRGLLEQASDNCILSYYGSTIKFLYVMELATIKKHVPGKKHIPSRRRRTRLPLIGPPNNIQGEFQH